MFKKTVPTSVAFTIIIVFAAAVGYFTYLQYISF